MLFLSLILVALFGTSMIFIFNTTVNDVAEPWGLFFQDNAPPQMEGLEELHNNIMFYLTIILFAVSWIMLSIILNYNKAKISNKYVNHATLMEFLFSITPALILVLIVFPLFSMLSDIVFSLIYTLCEVNLGYNGSILSLIDSLCSTDAVKSMLLKIFDNLLYSNVNSDQVSEISNTGDVSDESSTTSSEAPEDQSVTHDQSETQDQDSVSSGGGADSDSFDSDRDTSTCQHVTNPDGPACTCLHEEAGFDWKISTHHDRCHECTLSGSTISCDNCLCLFHEGCLPSNCTLHEDFSD